MNKTLYVGPRQAAVWELAQRRAELEGVSVSSLATRALREYFERHPEPNSVLVRMAGALDGTAPLPPVGKA